MNGQTEIHYWPLSVAEVQGQPAIQFGQHRRLAITGKVQAAHGNTLFIQYGQTLAGMQIVDGGAQPFVGYSFPEDILAIAQRQQQLFVLTESGVHLMEIQARFAPVLEETLFIPQTGYQGLHVSADQLLLWNAEHMQAYRLNPNNTTTLLTAEPLTLTGTIAEAASDGEITWLKLRNGLLGDYWQAWINEADSYQVAGHLNQAIEHLTFVAGKAYGVVREDNLSKVMQRAIQTSGNLTQLTLNTYPLASGLLVSSVATSDALGSYRLSYESATAQVRPAQSLWNHGQFDAVAGQQIPSGPAWLIPYTTEGTETLTAKLADHAGARDTGNVEINFTADATITALHPVDGANVAADSLVSVNVQPTADTRTHKVSLGSGTSQTLASQGNQFYRWVRVPKADEQQNLTNIDLSLTINDVAVQTHNLQTVENIVPPVKLILSGVINNQMLLTGETLSLGYAFNHEGSAELNPFVFVEITLFDFNGNEKSQILSGQSQGGFSLRLPPVTAQETYKLRVRGYFGEFNHYVDNELGIRIAPRSSVPEPVLSGLPNRVLTGSELTLSLQTDLGGEYSRSIQVLDQNEQLLAAGADSVQFSVPDGVTHLKVITQIDDQYGHVRSKDAHASVVLPFNLVPTTASANYDALLVDVDGYWLAQGNELHNQEGLQKAFEGPIKAIAHLSDHLLLAIEGFGLTLVDPARNFQLLSHQPYAQAVEHMASTEQAIVIVSRAETKLYAVSGNALTEVALPQELNQALDVRAYGEQFLVLKSNRLYLVDSSGQIRHQYSGSGFTGLTVSDTDIVVSRPQGVLTVLDGALTALSSVADINGDYLLPLQGYVLALSSSQQHVQVVDITDPKAAQRVGNWSVPIAQWHSQPLVVAGQIWMGDESFHRYDLNLQQSPYVELYNASDLGDSISGFVRQLVFSEGVLLSAADNYGAVAYQQQTNALNANSYVQTTYPAQGFTQSATAVAADSQYFYIHQPDQARIKAVKRSDWQAQDLFKNDDYVGVVVTASHIVSAVGNQVVIASQANHSAQQRVTLSTPDAIKQLVASDSWVFATTDSGAVYRVDPVSHSQQLLHQISGVMLQPVSNEDYLFYLNGISLQRVSIANGEADSLQPFEAIRTRALAYAEGLLWLAYESAEGQQIVAIDPQSLQVVEVSRISSSQLPANSVVSALAVEHDRLAIGLGSLGVSIQMLPHGLLQAHAPLTTPLDDVEVSEGQQLIAKIPQSTGISAVRYLINGQKVATSTNAPFVSRLAIPTNILNGNTFTVSTEVQHISGSIQRSAERTLLLRSGDIIGNDFRVDVDFPTHSWGPKPLEIRASVDGSEQPIARVEYFMANTEQGPWTLIGSHKGPQYVIYKDFGTEQSGQYLKAKAIDVFGNVAESTLQRFYRHLDNVDPTASIMVAGDAVTQNGTRVVAGTSYTVNITLNDDESGVEKALLKRNGQLVAAHFANGALSYQVDSAVAGSDQYSIEVQDHAFNSTTVLHTVSTINDNKPTLDIVSAPTQIREKSTFSVNVTASDDVAVDYIETQWNGFTKRFEFNAASVRNYTLALTDQRSERVSGSLADTLTIKVADSAGQETLLQHNISVIEDRVPSIAGLIVNVPQQAFYGGQLPISLIGLNLIDDSTPVALKMLAINGAEETVAWSYQINGQSSLSQTLRLPSNPVADNTYKFKLVFTDVLTQSVATPIYSVSLTQAPNQIRFATQDALQNPTQFRVGDTPQYRVEVLDSSGRVVPGQAVSWSLKQSSGWTVTVGNTQSSIDGSATLQLNSSQIAQTYELRASLPAYPLVSSAVINVSVTPGDAAAIELDLPQSVKANENFVITAQAKDAVGNSTNSNSIAQYKIRLPDPSFAFVPEEGVEISTVSHSGQQVQEALVSLVDGVAGLVAKAGTLATTYQLAVTAIQSHELLLQGDVVTQLPITVVAGNPSRLALLDKDGNAKVDGNAPLYGTKHIVPINVVLQDNWGNRVHRYQDADANYPVQIVTTGNAEINGQAGLAAITLNNGIAELEITDSEFETITLSIGDIAPELINVDKSSTFVLQFNQQPPEIVEAMIAAPFNSTELKGSFVYDEAVQVSEAGVMLRLYKLLGDSSQQIVAGSTQLQEQTVYFSPVSSFALDTCYLYKTEGSVLEGIARGDGVRVQSEEICSPQLLINIPEKLEVLEGQSLQLNFTLSEGLSINNVDYHGIATINEATQPFIWRTNYYDRKVTIPAYSGADPVVVNDGDEITAAVSGMYNGNALRIGNVLKLRVFSPDTDFDGDGLSNRVEVETEGLSAFNSDTDGDGILDGVEDLDGDGLTNIQEVSAGTGLRDSDSDNDGLNDGVEVLTHGSDPLDSDSDDDGLTDGSEVSSIPSSSPISSDTDSDGIDDRTERNNGLNPSDSADGTTDKDSDGLSNAEEAALGTNISDSDSDNDGLLDGEEVNNMPATNPLAYDTDGDGLNDKEDYAPTIADIDPPQVIIESPDLSQPFLKGQTISLVANAADAGRVIDVRVRVNNIQIRQFNSAPYSVDITLPTDADSVMIEVLATDTNSNQGTTGDIPVTLIDDPMTTIIGLLVDNNGIGVAGVTVNALGMTAETQADGTFVIVNVPVAAGNVIVSVSTAISDINYIAQSDAIAPEWGGTTDVGILTLRRDKARVGYFHSSYNTGQVYQKNIIEAAGMEAIQITNLAAFDMNSIDMLMLYTDNCSNYANYTNYKQKVFDFVSDGGVLIHHEDRPSGCSNSVFDIPGEPASLTYSGSLYYGSPWNLGSEVAIGDHGNLIRQSYSSHAYGYADLESLAEGVNPVMYSDEPYLKRVTGFDYPWGEGQVYFSTIRLWHISNSSNYHRIYAPNLLKYMYRKTLIDTDGDGAKDTEELKAGTDVNNPDSDEDGLTDGFELRFGFNPLLDSGEANLDGDNDGLTNAEEALYGTNPADSDTDNDNLNDGMEVKYELPSDPTMLDTDLDRLNDANERTYRGDPRSADTDMDQLSDYDERQRGTRLDVMDTDGDGISDYLEVQYGLNPTRGNDAYLDADNDGLSNRDEIVIYGTPHNKADADNDGLNDGQEVTAGSSPLDEDSDNDGLKDGEDTDPLNVDTVAPLVMLTSPVDGAELLTGQHIVITANVQEAGRVTLAHVYANNVLLMSLPGDDLSEDYSLAYTVPVGVSEVNFKVVAEDTNGNVGESASRVFAVINTDPLAAVTGRVVDVMGQPVAEAAVKVFEQITQTDENGLFILSNLPTTNINADVNAEKLFGMENVSASINVNLDRGGVVDVGDMVLSRGTMIASSKVGYFDGAYGEGAAYQEVPILTAGLTPIQITSLASDDFSHLGLILVTRSDYDSYLSNKERVFNYINDGGVLVIHDRVFKGGDILVGNSGVYISRSENDLSILSNDPRLINGPGGILDNTSLDNGGVPPQGYLDPSSAPDGAIGLLSQNITNGWIAYTYPYGKGHVVYSSIPLSYYFSVSGGHNFRDIYAPNLLYYASGLRIVDTDEDGISDADEVPLGLDPFNADSDGDQLIDGFEVTYNFDPLSTVGEGETLRDADEDGLNNLNEQQAGSNPLVQDTDGDGLSDYEEVNATGSDPSKSDTDNDQVDDLQESLAGSNPNLADSDSDGLTDYEELYSTHTNPMLADTDGNGLGDGFEFTYGLVGVDPTTDSDNDGLTHLQEYNAGTNPNDSDTDDDELLDGWEVNRYHTNPLHADSDEGGRWDVDELVSENTDPLFVDDISTIGLSQNLYDENGRYWNLNSSGYISSTTSSALSNALRLYVDNMEYQNRYSNGWVAGLSMDGRQLNFQAKRQGNLIVSRRAYVPASGGAFIRYLEILKNPTDLPVTKAVRISSQYNGASNTEVVTSSGNSQLTQLDDYLIQRDTGNTSRTVISYLFSSPNAEVELAHTSTANSGSANSDYVFDVTIPPNETRMVMHFTMMSGTVADAQAQISSLRTMNAVALAGLTDDEKARIVNIYAYTDTDLDGLSDQQEIEAGTLPENPDTDGDGINDGMEIRLGTDPKVAGVAQLTTIQGRVINALGAGIPDANVTIGGQSIVTNANGEYLLESVAVTQPMVNITASLQVDGTLVSQDVSVELIAEGVTAVEPLTLSYLAEKIEMAAITSDDLGNGISLSDDSYSQVLFTDGFSFPFYGVNYSSVYVGSNGFLTFNSGDSSTGYSAGSLNGRPRISPFWTDLHPYGNIRVYTKQEEDRFIVTWYRIPRYGSSSTANTFRATLHANGAIVLQWGDIQSSGNSILVGITPGGTVSAVPIDLSMASDYEIESGVVYEHFNGGFDLQNQFIAYIYSGANYRIAKAICTDTDGDELCDIEETLRGTFIDSPDTDEDGLSDSIDLEPLVADQIAPVVSLLTPEIETTLTAGENTTFSLNIDEDGLLSDLSVQVNGTDIQVPLEGPYQFEYEVPPTTTSAHLTVTATDVSGNQSAPADYEFSVSIPAATEITGRVVYYKVSESTLAESGSSQTQVYGIAGLNVEVVEQSTNTQTSATGTLSMPDVSTQFGGITLRISGMIEGQSIDFTVSIDVMVPGGTTDQGEINVLTGNPVLVDSDADGLVDIYEHVLGTDSHLRDSDNDGLRDDFEVLYGLNPRSVAGEGEQSFDADEDGLSNLQEQEQGTKPNNPDTDGDGLNDGVEISAHLTDPTDSDSDNDGLSDGDEIINLTDPNESDTDGDGLSDNWEVVNKLTSPLLEDSDMDGMPDKFEVDNDLLLVSAHDDVDFDGLTNVQEFEARTNPRIRDTDGDYVYDGLEIRTNTNPTQRDTDEDGIDDFRELFSDDTDPRNNEDHLLETYLSSYLNFYDGGVYWRLSREGYFYNVDSGKLFGTGMRLGVNSNYYSPNLNSYNIGRTSNGKEYRLRGNYMEEDRLVVSRRYMTDSSDSQYIRIVDVFQNISENAISIATSNYNNYSLNEADIRVYTSSGDDTLDTNDRYLIIQNSDDASQRLFVHVFADSTDKLKPHASSELYNGYRESTLKHNLDIPAGEKRLIVHFVTTANNLEAAIAKAEELAALPASSYSDISAADAKDILNFSFDLTPSVTLTNIDALPQPLLEGTVVDFEFQSLMSSSVTLFVNDVEYKTVSAMAGRVSVDVSEAASGGSTITIRAVANGFEGRSASTETISLDISSSASVQGTVEYFDSGEWRPFSRVDVTIFPAGINLETDDEGFFIFNAVPPSGEMTIDVEGYDAGENYLYESFENIMIDTAGVHDVGVLRIGGPETITVVGSVLLYGESNAVDFNVRLFINDHTYDGYTDSEGNFVVDGIIFEGGVDVSMLIEGEADGQYYRQYFDQFTIESPGEYDSGVISVSEPYYDGE